MWWKPESLKVFLAITGDQMTAHKRFNLFYCDVMLNAGNKQLSCVYLTLWKDNPRFIHIIFNVCVVFFEGIFLFTTLATTFLNVAPAAMMNACWLLFAELLALLRASTVFHQVGIHMVTSCKDIPHVRLHFLNHALQTNNITPWEPMWILMWFMSLSMIILICLVTDWANELAG